MAEMLGWLRKGVGELIRQAALELINRKRPTNPSSQPADVRCIVG